jgi:hypothetical protein
MKSGFLDVKSPNFLGGNNVHHAVIIAGVAFLVYKAWKK